MREYKIVLLNGQIHMTRKKDIEEANKVLNEYASQGWVLQQIATPNDGLGSLVAIMYREF